MTQAALHQGKTGYHHGQLREALVDAALEALQKGGVDDLSLRGLAKATGVTQAAPYSHFRDKDDLLAAAAERGFQRLALQMASEAAGTRDKKDRVKKLVSAYIRFAAENRTLFQLMFGREFSDMKKYPTLAMTAGKSYALIAGALTSEKEDTRFLTVCIWSLGHGLATLFADRKVSLGQFDAASIDDFTERALQTINI